MLKGRHSHDDDVELKPEYVVGNMELDAVGGAVGAGATDGVGAKGVAGTGVVGSEG
jgi:hypothetical protein